MPPADAGRRNTRDSRGQHRPRLPTSAAVGTLRSARERRQVGSHPRPLTGVGLSGVGRGAMPIDVPPSHPAGKPAPSSVGKRHGSRACPARGRVAMRSSLRTEETSGACQVAVAWAGAKPRLRRTASSDSANPSPSVPCQRGRHWSRSRDGVAARRGHWRTTDELVREHQLHLLEPQDFPGLKPFLDTHGGHGPVCGGVVASRRGRCRS